MEVLSDTFVRAGSKATLLRTIRFFLVPRNVYSHCDSMFNQHAKWLKTTRHIPWRRPIASLIIYCHRTSGGKTITDSRIKTRIYRPRNEQKSRGRPRLSAAGCQHAFISDRPLIAQPQLRQRHCCRKQPALQFLIWTKPSSTARRESEFGIGRATTTASNRMS
jgi:hypothetical protein